MQNRTRLVAPIIALALAAGAVAFASNAALGAAAPTTTTRTVTFSGGFATDPRDGGRPVVLIAAGLGVPTEVFRKAFSGVTPTGGGSDPSPALAQANKAALLRVLAPYGVTNERLDEVSNFYRYFGGRGETWSHTTAKATATIRSGKVTSIKITRAGAGYSSTPTARIAGFPNLRLTTKVRYGTNLATNGRVASVSVAG